METKIRKIHSSAFKAKVAMAAIKEQLTIAQICSEFGIAASMVSKWKKEALDGMSTLFEANQKPSKTNNEAQLEKLYSEIGRLKVENTFLKKKCFM